MQLRCAYSSYVSNFRPVTCFQSDYTRSCISTIVLLRMSTYVNKKVQLDATIRRHLFTAKSLYMFRASQHPSSGALKTVTATSGIGHNTGTATSFQRGLILIRARWKEVAVPVLWPIPEVAVTVFSTPDDGRCDARNM